VTEDVLHQAVIAQYNYGLTDQDLIPTMDRISPLPSPPVCPNQLWNLQSFLSKLQAAQAINHGLIPVTSMRLLSSPKCPA